MGATGIQFILKDALIKQFVCECVVTVQRQNATNDIIAKILFINKLANFFHPADPRGVT